MALTVETGIGVPNADSWATMAEANDRATKYGNSLWVDGEVDVKEPAMRRGADYLIAVYGTRFPGKKTNPPDEQNLPWPRANVVDDDGNDVPDDLIPANLKAAQIEAAFLDFNNPGALQPTSASRVQKSVSVGPISVTYEDSVGNSTGPGGQPLFSIIDGLMVPLLDANKTGKVQFLLRA